MFSRRDRQAANQLATTIIKEPPSEVFLRPPGWRLLLLLLFAAGFLVIGVLMIRDGDLRGWFVALASGAGTLVALVAMLPGASYLKLGPEGFTICSLFRKSFLSWTNVQDFRVISISLNKMVGFDYAPHYQRAKRTRRFSAVIAAAEGGLPDTYGLGAAKLTVLMTVYRDRALKAVQEQPTKETTNA